jgi:type I restriction enzyme R subunit
VADKEAKARIKINKLLEAAGWRFFEDESGAANIQLEPNVQIKQAAIDALGVDFEKTKKGAVDFLLTDLRGFPLVVLEAKAEDRNPLVGKEQARTYARSLNCRFVILSNGNLHYFWDLERGNPYVISQFPTAASLASYNTLAPDSQRLVSEVVEADYIVRTQFPNYREQASWKNEAERAEFIEKNRLRFLRDYQLRAMRALQRAVKAGNDRFLFEMATGTGKTLTAAAVIKLFLRTGNARRVLFLVDRLELEDQANKAFIAVLHNDFKSVIYKETRDDWRKAEIVVTTVQSLLFGNKFRRLFSPTDFDLIISDEAHRSIGGNARAVFEYFVGYKLGLTATPKDYLKRFDQKQPVSNDPREFERRVLLDTYRTFGCESGEPTFRYSLLDGVADGYLVNPIVVDARSTVTTQLLSDEGYAAMVANDEAGAEGDGQDHAVEQTFRQSDFERRFFSESTNRLFCKIFLEHALRDPISGEIGKSIVFAVSQNHAAKLTQILNQLADQMYPGRYSSDFALQVTSLVADAQQFTINFTNNNLSGSANFTAGYKTSKTRVCVTVGMMTTGYDCPDLLNLALMRPIFSPTDFIQIKGRGTRRHNFLQELFDADLKAQIPSAQKLRFKLFDFFANNEYFEETFNYDEVLTLPAVTAAGAGSGKNGGTVVQAGGYEVFTPDELRKLSELAIGQQGMKIDRMLFQKFEQRVQGDELLRAQVAEGRWEQALAYVMTNLMDKPEEFFNLDKLRKAAGVNRRLSLREMLEKAFGFIPAFKSRDEMIEEEFAKFVADVKPDNPEAVRAMNYFFKAYISDGGLRETIDKRDFAQLYTTAGFSMEDFKAVPPQWRTRIPEYIKDYVPLNQFAA